MCVRDRARVIEREREKMRDLDLPQVSSPYKRCYSDNYRVEIAWRTGKLAEFFFVCFIGKYMIEK